jgi:hypothetical protein
MNPEAILGKNPCFSQAIVHVYGDGGTVFAGMGLTKKLCLLRRGVTFSSAGLGPAHIENSVIEA